MKNIFYILFEIILFSQLMISCTMISNYDEQFYPEILLYNDKSDFKLYKVPVFDNFNFSINYPNILYH